MDSYGEELVQISTRDIMDGAVVKTVCNIEVLGKQAYNEFIEERIRSSRKQIEDPVKKYKLPLFSTIYRVKQPCRTDRENILKERCKNLFAAVHSNTNKRWGLRQIFQSWK